MNMDLFPIKQPSIYFNSKLNHPLVNDTTGELDVSSTLSDVWNYFHENMLYNLMKDIKKMFTDKHQLSNRFSFNRNMAELFERNLH
jgi:ubiquitin-protein ligase